MGQCWCFLRGYVQCIKGWNKHYDKSTCKGIGPVRDKSKLCCSRVYKHHNELTFIDRRKERNILSNPFKRFEDMNMLRHTKTLGVVEVDSTVWKKLTDIEKKWIEDICDERLEKYYKRIRNARQN